MKISWKSLCRRLLPLLLLGLLLCFSPSAQAQGDAVEAWPPENLLREYDPEHPENTTIDYNHHLVIYRFDMYQTTSGASRERVEGRDSFDAAKIYPDTDFTVHFSQDWKTTRDLALQYDYYPRSGENRFCWASAAVGSSPDYMATLTVELTGLDGAVRRQTGDLIQNGLVTIPSVQGTTPYAAQARFSGYDVQFGNIAGTWDEIFLPPV